MKGQQISQLLYNCFPFHKGHDTLIDVYAPALYCFYKAHNPAVHISAGCAPETACHLVPVLAHPQILFAHVVAVMNPEII